MPIKNQHPDNECAEFFPVPSDDVIGALPRVRVGDLDVTVYREDDGSYHVTISNDVGIDGHHADGTPNLRVVVHEMRIYDDTAAARADRSAFAVGVDDYRPDPAQVADLRALGQDLNEGCEGHESLNGADMGQSVYCNGSCR